MLITQFVNSVFNSNSYLIEIEKTAALIDIGDYNEIKKLLFSNKLLLDAVFLTHIHYDHIYGLPFLLKKYPSCKIYTNDFGKMALASSKVNFSKYHNDPIEYNGDNVVILREGDSVVLGDDLVVNVYETPGHDKSCLSYRIGNNLFSGDSFIPGIKVVDTFPNSNKEDAKISKARLEEMATTMNLYPGHGEIYLKATN